VLTCGELLRDATGARPVNGRGRARPLLVEVVNAVPTRVAPLDRVGTTDFLPRSRNDSGSSGTRFGGDRALVCDLGWFRHSAARMGGLHPFEHSWRIASRNPAGWRTLGDGTASSADPFGGDCGPVKLRRGSDGVR